MLTGRETYYTLNEPLVVGAKLRHVPEQHPHIAQLQAAALKKSAL